MIFYSLQNCDFSLKIVHVRAVRCLKKSLDVNSEFHGKKTELWYKLRIPRKKSKLQEWNLEFQEKKSKAQDVNYCKKYCIKHNCDIKGRNYYYFFSYWVAEISFHKNESTWFGNIILPSTINSLRTLKRCMSRFYVVNNINLGGWDFECYVHFIILAIHFVKYYFLIVNISKNKGHCTLSINLRFIIPSYLIL